MRRVSVLLLVVVAACGPVESEDEEQVRETTVAGPDAVDVPPGEYASVGTLLFDDHYCTGTLIAPDAVLTAAHCVIKDPTALLPYSVEQDIVFAIGETRYSVAGVTFHFGETRYSAAGVTFHEDYVTQATQRNTCWSEGGQGAQLLRTARSCQSNCTETDKACSESSACLKVYQCLNAANQDKQQYDLAVVKLQKPVTEVAPSSLCTDPVYVGEQVVQVGRGDSSYDLSKATYGTKRKVTQTVTEVESNQFRVHFETSGAASGDSGGPEFTVGGQPCQVGLHSRGETSLNIDIRVDSFRRWISNHACSENTYLSPAGYCLPCGGNGQPCCSGDKLCPRSTLGFPSTLMFSASCTCM